MLWGLPASVRSLIASNLRRHSSTAAPQRRPDPLRILFCGADDFSIASLRALAAAKTQVPHLIESIDVVHRPAKPTGRGLKVLREVPIKHVATTDLDLPTHALDTFTRWTPPSPIDLVIAVSFGLFVPPRILNLAQYGGLNVHPSLLPDLRGPAPIEHAILKRRTHTGVSIQTLHPEHFDRGRILAQTPAPGLPIPAGTRSVDLEQRLAVIGAGMLVDVLKTGAFVPPLQDVGWYTASSGPTDHAPKITKQDRFVDFRTKTIDDILAMHYALGDTWTLLPNGNRLIMHKIADTRKRHSSGREPGIWIQEGYANPLFCDAGGNIGVVVESTYAGAKAGQGNAKLRHVLPEEEGGGEAGTDMLTWLTKSAVDGVIGR